jgi:glutamate/tyrosine decarboxylase-like PLP-dependent enzyme
MPTSGSPYDSGLAICRDPADLRRALAFDAAYLATNSDRALAHLGLQMSQRARGVETWAILACHGRSGVAALVDRLCDHARAMAERLTAAGARLLVPPTLNQVLVQFDDDTTTDAVIAEVQRDGTIGVGGTTWQQQRAMRISVCDTATTRNDIERAAAAIVGAWRAAATR